MFYRNINDSPNSFREYISLLPLQGIYNERNTVEMHNTIFNYYVLL
jgi:hypothetical protein